MAHKKFCFCRALIALCIILSTLSAAYAQEDIADVPSKTLFAGEDKNKQYFLIGNHEQAAPEDGFGLAVVLPGGEDIADPNYFVKRIYKNALPKNYLVAQLVPVRWTPEQQVAWPTGNVPAENQQFSSEEFIEAVIKDVRTRYKVNDSHIFTLSWSSAGPAGYAYSLQKDTLVTGSFIAMSAFEPENLPPLEQANGRAYVLFHSATDESYPYSMARQASDTLKEKGAKVVLLKHRGKQSWQQKPYRQIRLGISCLERDHAEPAQRPESDKRPARANVRTPPQDKTPQEALEAQPSANNGSLKLRRIWEVSIPHALCICAGDWNLDGQPEILVSDANEPPRLHVIDSNGREITTVLLPDWYPRIECGRIKGQPALLAYKNGSLSVTVLDRNGMKPWAYVCKQGVNCAHWGDLDGDGNDEMVVGVKGPGGLHAVSENGKRLWKVSEIANVWNLSVISARQNRPATIIATEFWGTVRTFDGTGKSIGTFTIEDLYFIPVQAAEIDANGTIQILGIGMKPDVSMRYRLYSAVTFDVRGNVAWQRRISSKTGDAAWRGQQFITAGDLNGDGLPEWVYADRSNLMSVASPANEEIATIDTGHPDHTVILSFKNKKGRLVFLRVPTVSCYEAE